jgi:hypothetical protein
MRTSLFAVLLLGLCLGLPRVAGAQEVSFQRDIRPLLSDRCFKCHGFDDEMREADLGLHLFEEATRDLGGYRAVAPGDSAASELIARLISDDADEVMPPPKSNKPKFSEAEVALMKRWIDQGAKYEQHWAFIKPVASAVPAGEGHAIDRFLAGPLAASGLEVNERADPYTLIRRLSYDLRGLPPTVAETDAFVAAHSADPVKAWANLVDSFLASPAYGERWARDWLDLARYADSNGYEKDRARSIWPYRDWVVRALNADMPYDQFTIEQLAGDMLPDPTIDQLVATGFHRNTMLNEEGGIDPLEFRYHAMVDRVAATGSVWMGLTTGCAQCHTHKFDPITHTDYFALMALMDNADEPEIEVPVPALEERRTTIRQQMDELEAAAFAGIDEARYQAWLAEQKKTRTPWTALPPLSAKSNMPLLEIEPDHAIFASGDFTKRDVYEITLDLSAAGNEPVTALRLEVLPDPRLPANGPGAAYYEGRKGDFFLSEVTATADGQPVPFADASVSFGKISIGSGAAEGKNIFDGDGSTGWSTATQEGQSNELVIVLASPLTGKTKLDLTLLFERHFVAGLGKFRLSATTAKEGVIANASRFPDPFAATDRELRLAYVRAVPEFEKFRTDYDTLLKSIPAFPTTLVMKERPPQNPRVTKRHHRGEYLSPKEDVAPAVPVVFEPIPEDQAANRLGLAKWLVSDRNPLAARVAANRAWTSFFGRGIVNTLGDYGYQSAQPSHPELLDWLAIELVAKGWSMKTLHRTIVTSAAYQRDSRIDSVQLGNDPDNVLLARGPRFRLTGEMIRDSALHASGLLSTKTGGPGVFPPQTESVVGLSYGGAGDWKVSTGEDRYRRSLYTFAKRTAPYAAYLTFDGPTGESCQPQRDRSNTPLQALTLLNDPMFHEAAEALAKSTGSGEGAKPVDPGVRLEQLFRRILTRPPTVEEKADFLAFYEAQRVRLDAGDLQAATLLEDKINPTPETAAWKMVARVLLNLNEAITKG